MRLGSRFVVPAIVIALLIPTALSPVNAASTEDLYVTSVVVVQVVPEPRGVVVNKSAALCVTVINAFDEEVYANISVTYNHGSSSYVETGPDRRGIPLAPGVNTVYVPGGNCTSHPLPWTSEPATFMWTEPGLDSSVIAWVDPDNSVVETDETNNQMTTDSPIDAWVSHDLRILVVPIYCSSSALWDREPPEFSLDEELREVLDTFPLADDGVEIVEAPPRDERYDSRLWTDCAIITKRLSAEARVLGYDRVVAVFEKIRDTWGRETYGSAVGCLDEPRDPVPLFITANGIDVREALLAHELGHTYYLWHPHDIGISVYDATKWSVSERAYGVSANTWMSNPGRLPSGVPVTPRWIDNERYQDHERSYIDLSTILSSGPNGTWEWNLFSQLVYAPPTLGPIVVIDGSILRSGAAIITRPWFTTPLGVPEEQIIPQQGPVGSYLVRMLDSSRNILGNTYFNVSFTRLTHDDGENESYLLEEIDSVDFVVNAPNLPDTRYVQILDPLEAVLAERIVTTSVPTVDILSPNGAEDIDIGQSPEISWTADDLDGDDLSYLVSYTPDDGRTWIPVANNLTASSYIWNTTGVAPTEKCRIRVMASDGFNTGEDCSDAVFRMSDSIPPTTRAELNGTVGQDYWYVSGVDVSLSASDNSRVSRTEYSLDNSTWTTYKSDFRLSNEGANILSFRSTDLAGNVEPIRSATVKIDVTAPSLSINSPPNGSSVDEDVIFEWAASDTVSGIARFEVRLDSGAWTDVGSAQQWEGTGLTDGAHTFEVRATDAAGNEASTTVDFNYRESSGIALWVLILVAGTIVAAGTVLGVYRWRKGKD
ncbi:MAG: Ig-like domain-containing protein [Thermoplasmata archaeon]